jgi:hypothetical protein
MRVGQEEIGGSFARNVRRDIFRSSQTSERKIGKSSLPTVDSRLSRTSDDIDAQTVFGVDDGSPGVRAINVLSPHRHETPSSRRNAFIFLPRFCSHHSARC